MPLAILFHFLCAQHVSDINTSIIRSLQLFCWITTLVILFLVRSVLEFRCGWVGVVSVLQAEAQLVACSVIFRNKMVPHSWGFLDLTQRRTIVGSTPLDEWSVRRRPLPDNTKHSQQANIHAPGGIRTHNPSRRAAVDLRLRPRGHWDRLVFIWEQTATCATYGINWLVFITEMKSLLLGTDWGFK